MIPEDDLQLRVVIRALREVVADAIDPANPAALEQLRTSIALLELLAARCRLDRARAGREFANALAMARAVAALQPDRDLLDAIEAAGRLPVDQDGGEQDMLRKALLEAVSHVVNAPQAAERRRELGIVIVKYSRPALDLARAWYSPAGFETGDETLRTLDELLAHRTATEGH